VSDLRPAITVCVPTIPTRIDLLGRALASVSRQTLHASEVIVEVDHARTGAAATRQRCLDRVTTPLVAFLDDDDELFPRHLELLEAHLRSSGADVAYPWFEVAGGEDPFPDRFGQPFDPELIRVRSFVPITVLARTEALRAAGGFREAVNDRGWTNEDWVLWNALVDQGSTLSHLAKRTWTWHHWSGNTSGNPKNW
jgi:glycosyltransferase involved in cell wall biosynthesis